MNSTETKLYRQMYRIRAVEEMISAKYSEGKMRCPTHLSIGQEAVAAAFSLCIKKCDFAVSTHRGHAHYLGKGGNLNAMIAELYGKKTGCSGGKGGSMHLIDRKVNFMGTSAIVGNSIPVGVGLGLSIELNQTDQISCIFLGDGAVEEGVFYESINFTALRKLPVLFICENNLYSVYSPLSVRQPKGRVISDMVSSIGIESYNDESNDSLEFHNTLKSAIVSVRSGAGPKFLEFNTYRWREHCGPDYDNHLNYRTEREFQWWQENDPIKKIMSRLTPDTVNTIKKEVEKEIKASFKFAEDSPFPAPSNAYKGIYAV